LKFRNFGKKSLSELEELVRDKGLTFGMDVAKFKLNED
jgi:DNA-directed RNA polymerase subunit alpha